MPLCSTRHLTEHTRIGKRVIEITSLPIEGVRVCKRTVEVCDEVGEIIGGSDSIIRASLDLIDRVFHGIGVQVTYDEEVRVAAACWVGGKPIDQGFCRVASGLATISLTIQ